MSFIFFKKNAFGTKYVFSADPKKTSSFFIASMNLQDLESKPVNSIHWRVHLSFHFWDQKKYEHTFHLQDRLAQSKGRKHMVLCPKKGDIVSFVYKKKVVMRGIYDSVGFEEGTAHRDHPCGIGNDRPHTVPPYFGWVIINTVGLSEDIRRTGQNTWAKMPV